MVKRMTMKIGTAAATLAAGSVLALMALPAPGGDALVIADFEGGQLSPFAGQGAVATTEHATHGSGAVQVPGGTWFNAGDYARMPRDWSNGDVFRMDAFNPSEKAVRLTLQVRDPMGGRGYWAWHNRYVALAPGSNTVEFSLADMWRGEVLRHDIPGMLDTKNIVALNINSDGPYILDYVRLEKSGMPKVDVPGLKAFKVAKSGMPGFGGFLSLTEKDVYTKEKGWGWTRSGFGNMLDRIHPDNLFRSWIGCYNAELAVDLPNGKYRVLLQLEDPGYWEFMQNYRRRTVAAEGATVIDESMDAAAFKQRYFRNQDAEDFPGDDPFEKYVETRHPWHTFDVDVADGQLDLAFRSDDAYGNTLSAVIVYPVEQAEAGARFLAYVKGQRRADWAQRWKPVAKPVAAPAFAGAIAEEANRDGYALSAQSPYTQPSYDQMPQDAAALTDLMLAAAQDEFEPCVFGLWPAKPLGKVEVSVSALKGAAGEIPAANVSVQVGRYRFARFQGHQSGLYTVSERQLSRFNRTEADTLRCTNTMARRFWITVHVPADAAPGEYRATVTVKAEKGGTREIPLKVDVLPFKLPDPAHLFSLFGIMVVPVPYYPEMQAEHPNQVERMYRDLRDHGINYMDSSESSSVAVKWEGGKAGFANPDAFDKDLALRKSLGFKEGAVAIDGGCTLDELAAAGSTIRGLSRDKFIEAWHKPLTEFAKARGWPHPYFCYSDEPSLPETLNKLTAINNAVHAVSPDIWIGIAYHAQSPESYEMLKTLDVHQVENGTTADYLLARKAGKVVLRCNIGSDRLAFGAGEWLAAQEKKCDGAITFSYSGCHVDIYYGLDAREDDYNMAPPRLDGTLATTATYEWIREGIDDYRYAWALDLFTKDAKAAATTTDAAKGLLKSFAEIGGGKESGPAAMTRVIAWRADAQKLLAKAAGR